ncbi:MAG TPA: OmpA family protein [bacterium]|nr:OmpA family protein [bacterium]
MLHSKNLRAILVLAVFTVVMGTANGCATKGYVKKQVAELETRVNEDNGEIRTDMTKMGTVAESGRMMALGNVDYRTAEQFTVNFEFDSAALLPETQSTLEQVTSAVQQHPNYVVDLVGHADTIGDENYNEELSRRRANAVLHYLVQNGPGPVGRYAIVGFGETAPIMDAGIEDHDGSRRVEITLLEKVEPGSKSVISQADETPR